MSKDLPEEWHVVLDQIRFDGDSVKLLGLYLQCNLAFFMTLLIGPGLVSRDLANNGLPLYLSRPISRAEYVLGRLSVLFVLLSGLTWVPILGLFSLQWILGEKTAGAVDLRVAFGMVLGSILVILLLATTALALSAWVKWRMLAAFMMLVMFACGWLFSTMINGLFFRSMDTPWGHLINPGRLISIVWSQLLGLELPAGPPPLLAWTALAAIAAAAGVEAVVFVPASAPEAKLVQMLSYGARLFPVEGTYDQAFELSVAACQRFDWYNRNTAYNPYTVEGKKTAALEIAAQIAPQEADVVLVPTGDGVIVAGVAKGFADLEDCGLIRRRPRLIAVQPEGSAAIADAIRSGADRITPLASAKSVADSLNVETPRNALLALRQIRESDGGAVTVSDDAIVAAIAQLARTTGVFAEPAGAAALAGLHAALDEGLVDRDERIVLLVTGTGLKDVPAAARAVERPRTIPPSIDAVAEVL